MTYIEAVTVVVLVDPILVSTKLAVEREKLWSQNVDIINQADLALQLSWDQTQRMAFCGIHILFKPVQVK
jgi:hypothetical protein